MVAGLRLPKLAEKAPVLVAIWPAVSLVYDPELVPHSNDTMTVLAVPREVRLPLRVAEVAVTLVASLVVTAGATVALTVTRVWAVPVAPRVSVTFRRAVYTPGL